MCFHPETVLSLVLQGALDHRIDSCVRQVGKDSPLSPREGVDPPVAGGCYLEMELSARVGCTYQSGAPAATQHGTDLPGKVGVIWDQIRIRFGRSWERAAEAVLMALGLSMHLGSIHLGSLRHTAVTSLPHLDTGRTGQAPPCAPLALTSGSESAPFNMVSDSLGGGWTVFSQVACLILEWNMLALQEGRLGALTPALPA